MLLVVVGVLFAVLLGCVIKRNYGPAAALFLVFANLIYTILFGLSAALYSIHAVFLLVGYVLLIIAPHKKREYRYKAFYFSPVMLTVTFFLVVMFMHDHVISHYYTIHHEDMNAFEMRFLTTTFLPMAILPLSVTNFSEKDAFIDSIKYWGCLYLVAILLTFSLNSELMADRMLLAEMTDDMLSTIFLSRLAGLVVITSFVTLMFGSKNMTKKAICITIFAVFTFALLLLGQRGSVIGTFLGISILFLGRKERKYIVYMIPVALIAFIVLSQFEFGIFERFEELEDSESSSRYSDYSLVWKIFEENNFMTGLGSWGYDYYTGKREYPHSILLEHICNYGLLGLFCVSILYLSSIKHIIYILRHSDSYRDRIVCASWCVFAFSALVSSSIAGQQQLYLWCALLVIIYNEVKIKNKLKKSISIPDGKVIDK